MGALLAANSYARSTAVNIGIFDGVALEESGIKSVTAFLQENLPCTKVIEISTPGPFRKPKDQSGIRQELVRQMQEKLDADDLITHLVINTHAATKMENNSTFISLRYMGRVFSGGVDKEFAEAFAPLRGRMAQDASITFNSCKTFCGEAADAGNRAKAILDYLRVKDGSIYGAETFEMLLPGDLSSKFALGEMIPNWDYTRMALPISFGFALATRGTASRSKNDGDFVRDMAETWPLYIAGAEAFFIGTKGIGARILSYMGKFNRGRIFKFSDGKLISALPVKKLLNLRSAYGISGNTICSGKFQALSGEGCSGLAPK